MIATDESAGGRPESERLGALPAALLLFGIAAAAGCCGDFRASLDRLLFFAAAAPAYALILRRAWPRLGAGWRLGLPAAALGLAPLAAASDLCAWLALATVLYFAALALSRRAPLLAGDILPWVAALGASALCARLFRSEPLAFSAADALFREASLLVNRLAFGVPFSIGSSFFACEWLLCYWLFVAVRWARTPRRAPAVAALALGVLAPFLLVPALHLLGARWNLASLPDSGFFEPLFERGASRRLFLSLAEHMSPRSLNLFFVLSMIGLEVLLVGPWLRRAALAPATRPGPRASAAALVLVACCGFALAPLCERQGAEAVPGSAPRALFLDPSGVLLAPPTDERFGFVLSGMFSKLPSYLELLGFATGRWSGAPLELEDCSVLVLINLPEELPPEETRAIHDYLRRGGSLLCLGDHVAGEQMAGPFNRLLEPTGIRFRRDSARAFGGWTPDLLELHPYVYADPRPRGDVADTAAIGTGASLALSGGARPVFAGRIGFSDAPDPRNEAGGELGDLRYAYGEDIGDLVLAAEDRLGRGRVLVFGDTSSFQNATLCLSHGLVARVFSWLARPAREAPRGARLLLPCSALLLLLLFRRAAPLPALLVALLACCHERLDENARARFRPGVEFVAGSAARVAFLNNRHHSAYAPWGGTGEGMGGLDQNLLRRGIVALCLSDDLEPLARGRWLFILAPNRAISEEEAAAFESFMQGGGHVIVSADLDQAPALEALFMPRKISLRAEPLGRFQAESALAPGLSLEFVSGWPVDAVVRPEALASAWGRDLIARFPEGEGSLIVIGDGRFLREDNLESQTEYHPLNVAFLRALFERLQGEAAPAEAK
ncbi:MAG: hypothetical protein HY812_06590 [Planctomycetes bacterium]|nr:hypothetical protein [Planctomycetota bacterium]